MNQINQANQINQTVNIPINVIYSEHISQGGGYQEWLDNRQEGFAQYRRDWAELPQRFEVPRYPLNLDIEPTNRCNLRCPFCYRTIALGKDDPAFRQQGNMTLELFELILGQVSEDGKCMVPAIKLTHRGEPLLNGHLSEFVRMAKDAGAVDVIVNSNGSCMTDEIAVSLLEAGLDRMLFSFDSPRKGQYEAIRVGASYDTVLCNIRRFVELRDRLQKRAQTLVRVGMVVTGDTAPYMQEFARLFGPIADVVSFNKVHEEVSIDADGNYRDREGKLHNIAHRKFADSQLWQRMAINWDGEAEICCENYKQEYALGNVRDIPVVDIWHGERFRAARSLHREGKWWGIPQCRKCTLPWM